METVEIVSRYGLEEPLFRMKFLGFAKAFPKRFRFVKFGDGDVNTKALLINKLDGMLLLHSEFREKRPNAAVMLFLADLHPEDLPGIRAHETRVDLIIVPTQEMRDFLSALVKTPVFTIPDPIDFWITKPRRKQHQKSFGRRPLRVIWFGYPESYRRSMLPYDGALSSLVSRGLIDMTILTSRTRLNFHASFRQQIYDWQTAAQVITEHDVTVSSHLPFDFSVSTLMKSENKAILSIALGLPVVASRSPANTRLLSRLGLDNYLFSTSNELESALMLLEDPATRDYYLDRAQPIVAREYSYLEVAKQWESLLLRVTK